MTQGGPLSAKMYNILVHAVTREWLPESREGGDYYEVWELDNLMLTFFANLLRQRHVPCIEGH